MKKLVIVLLVTSILLISFVSAGWFGDVWSKITGRITEEKPDLIVSDIFWSPANPTLREEITFYSTTKNIGTAEVLEGISYQVCDYTDGVKRDCHAYGFLGSFGINEVRDIIWWPGTSNWPSEFSVGEHTFKVVIDENQIVDELNENNNELTKTFTVFSDESESEPIPSIDETNEEPVSEENNISCTDTDGGKDYYKKGETYGIGSTEGYYHKEDNCAGDNLLVEYYCVGNYYSGRVNDPFVCPYGCRDGACLREGEEELTEAESEQEVIPELIPPSKICAAKITINLDKDIYYYGDDFKLEIGIFDSQGNPLSRYPIYSTVYTYTNDMWHTPEEDKTGENGYLVQRGRIERGQQLLGKTKIKVYTPETSRAGTADCNSVESIVEIEIRRREEPEPVPCGIGTCIPEEEVEEVEAIPEDKILYACSGCELDDKCYPMGYRKQGKYCSDNYEFVNQAEEGMCDNHFECKSNICVSDECVGEGLIKKIIKWIKKMFGGDEDEEEKPEVDCSKLLIEKNIGDYEYLGSGYGPDKDTQAPLYSEEGAHVGVVKCCVAAYKNANEGGALICPYNNRQDVENLVKWAILRDQNIVLEEYKGQKVFQDGGEMMIWTHENYALVVVGERGHPFSEEIVNAYIKKYRSDLEIPETPSEEEAIRAKILTCEKITDSDERDNCYANLAGKIKDASLCEKIEDKNALCYGLVAQEIGDINLCEKISYIDGKHMCYSMVAAEMKDISLCEKITYDVRKEMCYSGVATQSKDISLCEKITQDDIKNSCYFSVAIESEDVSLCEKVTKSVNFDIDDCYMNIAIGTGDDSICEKIVDSGEREICYKDVPVGRGEIIVKGIH